MTDIAKSVVWFDGMWWEADIPAGWTHTRNRRNLFRSPANTRLWISSTRVMEGNSDKAPGMPSGLTLPQRQAYASVVPEARMSRADAAGIVTRRDAGLLVGFTYPRRSRVESGWTGWFASDPWMFYVGYLSRSEDGELDAAMSILASMKFFTGPAPPPLPIRSPPLPR